MKRIWEPEPTCKPAVSHEKRDGSQSHQRSAHIGVEEAMQMLLVGDHEIQRLNVYQYVCRTEGEEAYMPGRYGVNGCSGAKVKRRDWHFLCALNLEGVGTQQVPQRGTCCVSERAVQLTVPVDSAQNTGAHPSALPTRHPGNSLFVLRRVRNFFPCHEFKYKSEECKAPCARMR